MESCKFHPITPSVFSCGHCQDGYCDRCVDHSVGGEAHCFICGGHVEYQVTTDNVDPFWRRLEKAFKYPLNSQALMMVFGLSIASAILTALPLQGLLAFIPQLLIAGLTVNYAFLCMTRTSEGEMEAPPLADAWSGSLGILLKLFLMVIVIFIGLNALVSYVPPFVATIGIIVLFLGLPAILMSFAHTNSIIESVNPFNYVRIMFTVGVPYFVLLIFLFIMMTSVGILSSLVNQELAAVATILETSIANYYAVVAFHLMGYMLFQYQGKLGYSTGDDDAMLVKAEPEDVILAHVNIQLKQGHYQRAAELLRDGIAANKRARSLWLRCFDVLYRTENRKELQTFADPYFHHLLESAQTDRIASDYKKTKQRLPRYVPAHAHLRFAIANACHRAGDAMSTVQLINGLHKLAPDYDNLIPAYQLMHQALQDIPAMAGQAEQCAKMITQLQRQQKSVAKPQPVPEQPQEPVNPTESAAPTDSSLLFTAKDPVENPFLRNSQDVMLPDEDIEPMKEKDLAPIEFKL